MRQTAAGSAVLTFGAAAPQVLCDAADASRSDQRVLVVVEMTGGNDGLNTIVPHSHPVYTKSRDALRIAKSDTLSVNNELGLHPSTKGFADLLESNRLAIVQGIGYPNPNRSHFESMDIWHTCLRKDMPREDGWLGRYLQTAGLRQAADPAALHLGADKQPFALMSRDVRVPSIQNLNQFRLRDNSSLDLKATIRQIAAEQASQSNDLLGFIKDSAQSAVAASERMEMANQNSKSTGTFPKSGLGQKLQTVSRLIAADVETRLYYVRIDGFDTHAKQPDAHAALLREVSEAVQSFVDAVNNTGDGDRVLVMCFSEFGRRVAENASQGTDHGTAGPVLIAGNQAKAGLIGDMPRLTELENGDLKHHTDFRCVYATLLEDWFTAPSKEILGDEYKRVDFLTS